MRDLAGERIVLVGPLPPPPGGMANQTEQLSRLLASEGADVRVVRTNAPYRPRWIERVKGVRALFRLAPFVGSLFGATRGARLFHVMANSGWAWHFFAAPALLAARVTGVPAVVNYRGGDAAKFFASSFRSVARTLGWASAVVVPSKFLDDVFAEYGVSTRIVPNIIDLERFRPRGPSSANGNGPRLLIARSLEPIYDIETGIRTLAALRGAGTEASLDIAGSGPEGERLRALASELGLDDSVRFLGRVAPEEMPELYASADIALNTSLVDNMPNSVLEALACGVPVVSTNVGGVPVLVEDGREAVLVPPREPETMARAVGELWASPGERERQAAAGLEKARTFGWGAVRDQWIDVYADAVAGKAARK